MDKPLITIVVGHTEKAKGALAVDPLKMYEYDYNAEISKTLAEVLEKDFSVFVAFRDNMGIDKTYQEIEKLSPALNIELHFNSATDKKAFGTETLCSYNSRDFADIIQLCLCIKLNRDTRGNRGVKILGKTDRGYLSISKLKCPNVLIEPFFGSNVEDAKLGLTSKGKIVEAIYEAITIWFKKVRLP